MSYCLTCPEGQFKTVTEVNGKLTFKCVTRKNYTNNDGWTFDKQCFKIAEWCKGHGCLEQFTTEVYEMTDSNGYKKCVSRETCENNSYPIVDDINHACAYNCYEYGIKFEKEKAYHCVKECTETNGTYRV